MTVWIGLIFTINWNFQHQIFKVFFLVFMKFHIMSCIPDSEECQHDSKTIYCCSERCNQQLGESVGVCDKTTPKATTSSPTNTSTTTVSSSCLREGVRCQPDGTLGGCCSINCAKQEGDEFGRCVGSSPPTNVPERCLKFGVECKSDGTLGLCCPGQYCLVLAPHIFGICQTNPTTKAPDAANTTTNQGTKTIMATSNNAWIIPISVSLGAVALIVMLLALLWLYWRQRRIVQILSSREAKLFFDGDPESISFNGYAHENTENMPYNNELEISDADFTIEWENPLGQGCYGVVLKGKIKNVVNVAVKTLRNNNPETGTYLRALLCEIKVLQHIGKSDHVVSMIGCHTSKLRDGKVFLFLELCPLGSLEKYLRAHKYDFMQSQSGPGHRYTYVNLPSSKVENRKSTNSEISVKDLVMWSMQITDAMIYLAERKVIHADLATRNVLLMGKDCAKLTDFGLSRRLYEYGNYVKKNQEPLPWRWMALESLQQLTFSHQSDVWSLGITIWEIYSLGDVPYPGLSWTPEFVSDILENSLRPTKPSTASTKLYEILLDCWKPIPETRPTFREIYNRLYALK